MKKGTVIVISAPSGTGKTTICNLLKPRLNKNTVFSVSATTRKPRGNEVHGKQYYFISKREFKSKIRSNEFIEWAKVFTHYYGTLKSTVINTINSGKNVILTIDVQGGKNIRKLFPKTKMIFILPPSLKELERRLRLRHLDSDREIKIRLKIAGQEMKELVNYDYFLINDKLNNIVTKIYKLIRG